MQAIWWSCCASLLVAVAATCAAETADAADPASLPVGPARIAVPRAAPDGSAIAVWTYRPAGLAPTAPLVIVMHGVHRNAGVYRDNWIAAADRYRLLVAAPEMTKAQFPGGRGYNRGNMFDADKKPLPRSEWAWPVIEKVFDAVRRAAGAKVERYVLFGHSAGAQFTHRFVLFGGATRASATISANAGWYTMPTFAERFPYGLDGGPIDDDELKRALARPMVIMLGDRDTDPNHKYLRRTRRADRQGANRFQRGQAFFSAAQAASKRLGAPLNWRLEIVPGVGHANAGKTAASARWIAAGRR